jgi:hypothetical protein
VAALYLDGDDEIITAVGRIRAAEGPEVALVLPPGSRIGTSRINFRLLAREARDSGREVAIVTLDAAVRAVAVSAGLPAYASVADYEGRGDAPAGSSGAEPVPVAPPSAPRGQPGRSAPSLQPSRMGMPAAAPPGRRGRRGMAVLLLVGAVALTGAGAVFVLPSATITLVPRLEVVGPVNRTIVADPEATAPDLAAGVVPARTVEVPLQASNTFNATGVKVTETKATGKVTFTNNDTSASNTIPSGSVVATDAGVRFRTLSAVTVPRAQFPPPAFVPGKASVRIEAVDAGPAGNVAVNAIDKVPPGEDAGLLKVANTAATKGGTHTETTEVTQADVDGATATLTSTLQAQLLAAIASPGTAPAGATLIAATAAMGELLSEPAPAGLVGTGGPTFTLALTATATVLAVESAPLESMADEILQAAVPAGSLLLPDSVDRVIGAPAVQGGVVTFVIRVSARAWRPLDAVALLASVKGRPVSEARAMLETHGVVTIDTWPGYVDTIPSLDGHATLTVLAPGPTPTP